MLPEPRSLRSVHPGAEPACSYLEEGGALQHAGGAAHLPDGVHGQLRSADVQHGNAETSGQDGPDGGPAGAVVTDHHVLREINRKS